MKWKIKFHTLICCFLLSILFLSVVNASVIIKPGFIFRTTSNNAQFSVSQQLAFYQYKINSTHLWLNMNYFLKLVQYCIYVISPNNVQLIINSWFPIVNSTAQLTINSPTATNIDIGFTSPNLTSASVTGAVVSQTWNAESKTLTFTVNSNLGSTFTINVTVTYSTVYTPLSYTGSEPVVAMAMNNMFELNGILEGNDTYRQLLLDTSPYENHAKLYPLTHPYAGPTLTWGVTGKALQFDGVDDCAIIKNSESLNIFEAITIEFWFTTYNVSLTQTFISKYALGSGQWTIGLANSKLQFELWTTLGNLFSDNSIGNITTGVWHHAGLTYDYRDGYYTIWLHGIPQKNVATDGNKIRNINKDIYIGSLSNSANWFLGTLDELRIFPYKRSSDEIYTDARTPIVRFDTFSFVNSGTSNDGNNWNVVEGTNSGYQGFINNDPDLPWAYANNANPYAFVRTLKYAAGFQGYQFYCNIKYTMNDSNWELGPNYVQWYWNFFKNGRLQVTYDLTILPGVTSPSETGQWHIKFRRTTPYFGTQELFYTWFSSNTTLFPHSIPIIIGAWVGPDNKHFTVKFDVQDTRVITYYSGPEVIPFSHSFDLVDENLNKHITNWYDGWVVCGIKVNAHRFSSGKYGRMEIESHKLDLIQTIRDVVTVLGGPITFVFGRALTVITSIAKEVFIVLKHIVELAWSIVKKVGETIADALAGLAHDLLAGLAGIGNFLGQALKPLLDLLWGLGSSIVQAIMSFMSPLVTALVNTLMGIWVSLVGLLDGIFTFFGWHNGFSQILSFLANFLVGVTIAIAMLVQLITTVFSFISESFITIASYFVQFFNALGGFYANLVWIWEANLPYWSWIPQVLYELLPLIFLLGGLWIISPLFEKRNLQAGFEGVRARIDLTIGWVWKGAMLAWRVVDFVIDILYKLIEAIPVVE